MVGAWWFIGWLQRAQASFSALGATSLRIALAAMKCDLHGIGERIRILTDIFGRRIFFIIPSETLNPY